MADFLNDKNKLESIQKLLQSDPKTLEKLMGQITPEQVSAALNIFNSLDPKTQSAIGNIVSNLKTNNPDKR